MLFEDNFGFINYQLPKSTSTKKNVDLANLKDGYAQGNMFNDLYDPYKNYRPAKLAPKTKEEELLLEIMALSFAINDLGLYLDLHPDDEEVLSKFREYVEISCQKEMEYVRNYGPLEVIDNDNKNRFTWIKNPWPWENTGGVKYV